MPAWVLNKKTLQTFYFFKVFNIKRLLKSVISCKVPYFFLFIKDAINPIQDRLFRDFFGAAQGWGGGGQKRTPTKKNVKKKKKI